jgi:hypothetical protein
MGPPTGFFGPIRISSSICPPRPSANSPKASMTRMIPCYAPCGSSTSSFRSTSNRRWPTAGSPEAYVRGARSSARTTCGSPQRAATRPPACYGERRGVRSGVWSGGGRLPVMGRDWYSKGVVADGLVVAVMLLGAPWPFATCPYTPPHGAPRSDARLRSGQARPRPGLRVRSVLA